MAVGETTLDTTFQPMRPDLGVFSLAVQADGKILIGGNFSMIGGVPRAGLARLHRDGTLDTAFNPDVAYLVSGIAVQPDGRIWAYGVTYSSPAPFLARFDANGNLDETVRDQLTPALASMISNLNRPSNGNTTFLDIQRDGKVVLGGHWSGAGSGVWLARVLAEGTLDPTFTPGLIRGELFAGAVQDDEKILLGGYSLSIDGVNRGNLVRLYPDGSVDPDFAPDLFGRVNDIIIQPDGKILVHGEIGWNGAYRWVIRLHQDGSLDESLPPLVGVIAWADFCLQADGKMILRTTSYQVDGVGFPGPPRIHLDGTVDAAFNLRLDSGTGRQVLQADGKFLILGTTTLPGSTGEPGLHRFHIGPAESTLRLVNHAEAHWRRMGAVPEVCRVTFSVSPDGEVWTPLGAGSPISGGWRWTGSPLPTQGLLRAQGQVLHGSSVSVVQDTVALPAASLTLWRQAYFGVEATSDPQGRAADDADPDGDGFTNLEEYAANTHPLREDSRLEILSLTKVDNHCTLTFTGQLGRRYELQRRHDLPGAEWLTVTGLDPVTTLAPVTITDAEASTAATLYRLRAIAP